MRLARVWVYAATLAAGCGQRSAPQPGKDAGVEELVVFGNHANRQLDVLLMVDNAASSYAYQSSLTLAIPQFFDVLDGAPHGLPDVHVAVVSSDMGIGSDAIVGCSASGDSGIFHASSTELFGPSCATGLAAGARFVRRSGGSAPETNFSGDIRAVVQCITPIGQLGCGFVRPLDAVARALGADGSPAPAANQGFLRREAKLAIVFVTREDDCSARENGFYDLVSDDGLASPLGPLSRFRCAEFGYLCDGAPPRRTSPTGMVGDRVEYGSCVPSDDAGMLTSVAHFVDGVKALKSDPGSEILIASFQGPPTPFMVSWESPRLQNEGPWPWVMYSCNAGNETYAYPGVRMASFVDAFGARGLKYGLCEDDFSPALADMALRLREMVDPACIAAGVRDMDPDAGNGYQPDCTVTERVPDGNGGYGDTAIAPCEGNGSTRPCWALEAAGADQCPGGGRLFVTYRGDAQPPVDVETWVRCRR